MFMRRENEADRVRRYSSDEQLRRIDEDTRTAVQLYVAQSPEAIDRRIHELRCEWSVERYLQVNVAMVGVTTALLAVAHDRRWGVVACVGLAFFLFHAIDGFDPPLPLLRRMGVRTRAEIDREIFALKAARGDFERVLPGDRAVSEENVQEIAAAVGLASQ